MQSISPSHQQVLEDLPPGSEDGDATSDEHFHALFESIDEGVSILQILFDQSDHAIDYRFLAVNRAHHAVSGFGTEVVGKRISDVLPDIDSSFIERLGKVALTGEAGRFEHYVRPLDRWYEIYLSRFGRQMSRTVVAVFRDITERKRRERLQAFLLTLSDALRPLVDPQEIQVVAADLLGEHLQVNQTNYGEVRGEYVHISHSYANGLPPMVGTFHPEDFGKRLIEGHRAGRLQVCVNTTSDPLFDEQERKVLAAAHVGAYIAVPLVKEGVWVGVLSVLSIQPRNWAPTEVEAVQEVAERTWAAVERTRAERALSKSEEKYRSLFESIDEGVCTVEVLFDENEQAVDYRFLEINAAHEAMSGLGREAIGKRGRELIPAHEQSVIERLGQVALTGRPIRYEEYIDGLGRWFDIYLARDGGSDSRRVISVFNNITERKRREDNLRFLAETSMDFAPQMGAQDIMHGIGVRLARYLDLARCNFAVVDMDSDQIECIYAWRRDDAMADLMGKHRISDFLNKNGLEHYAAGQLSVIDDPQNNPLLNPSAHSLLDQLGVRSIVDVPCIKDGRWNFLLTVARSTAGKWHESEIELVRALAERIHIRVERARVEEALRESELRLQALIENLPGGAVFVVDKNYRYLIAEGEALTDAGLKPSDFLGKSIGDALQADLVSEYEPFIRRALAGEPFEHEHTSHDHVYLTRGVPLRTSGGEVYAVLAASFDITERKRAEAEAREADKRKDEFLAMLAHELRNPLAAISNATQVVKHLTLDNATVQRPREVIERQLQHLTRLVDDLLDMSRLTWGKINLKQETLPLATVLQRAIEATRPLIDARGQQLTITLPPLAVQVAGDATRLVQVFGNLLNNAAKYTDTGGQIALHTAIVDEEAIIRVRDNGCGLSSSLLPHVFELFTQAGRSLDRSQGGLGVGLALVYSLVKMHGGEVEAHSEGQGQGSEFVVRLPLARGADALERPSRDEATAQTPTLAPRLKVLVVEDNADAAEMLVLLLRHDGDEVRSARDGLTALDEARDFQPQVVLCDIGLPGLSGYEVAARLRQQPECQDTLLVALSGYGRDEDRRQSQLAGFDHHLTKPVDQEVLAALLQRRRLI